MLHSCLFDRALHFAGREGWRESASNRRKQHIVAERTFVMIKPDGVGRRLVGECIRRYEQKGLKLVGLKLQILTQDVAEAHYAEHKERPFFGELVSFITGGPTVQMVWEGPDAVAQVRKLNGATDCKKADLGSIRGDFGMSLQNNMIHASDSVETAGREIALYFNELELWSYSMPDDCWLQ
jgi:nucleoside-diphosphate kinase